MMEFWVKLLKVDKKQTAKAMERLKATCKYVDDVYWIFEGEPFGLLEDGVKFKIISEGSVSSLGGLNKSELRDLCKSNFGVNIF
ncbi:MAG: hypothetical protein ACI9EK_002834 [Psychroserpens sp.]|jgi:hypothetical protein